MCQRVSPVVHMAQNMLKITIQEKRPILANNEGVIFYHNVKSRKTDLVQTKEKGYHIVSF